MSQKISSEFDHFLDPWQMLGNVDVHSWNVALATLDSPGYDAGQVEGIVDASTGLNQTNVC